MKKIKDILTYEVETGITIFNLIINMLVGCIIGYVVMMLGYSKDTGYLTSIIFFLTTTIVRQNAKLYRKYLAVKITEYLTRLKSKESAKKE